MPGGRSSTASFSVVMVLVGWSLSRGDVARDCDREEEREERSEAEPFDCSEKDMRESRRSSPPPPPSPPVEPSGLELEVMPLEDTQGGGEGARWGRGRGQKPTTHTRT